MLNNPIELRKISIDIKLNNKFATRYINPPQSIEIDEMYLKYRNAEKLAKDIKIDKKSRYFVVIDGSFFFGDFIEALIVENNWNCKKVIISTLSMNQNNVDSLANLINGDFVQSLDLIVSDFFFSHERSFLIPYIYEKLDIDNKFQLAAAGTHCKLCIIETECGKKIVIHGSANLRTSSNIEQFVIEENECLYDFNYEFQTNIVDKYKTIKKSLRGSKLWQTVATEKAESVGEN
jgi:hypothetical protein